MINFLIDFNYHCSKCYSFIEAVSRDRPQLRGTSLSTQSQKTFAEHQVKYKKKFKQDKDIHDFSLTGTYNEEVWGITYFSGNPSEENIDIFFLFCNKRASERGATNWVGIFDTSWGKSNFIDVFSKS